MKNGAMFFQIGGWEKEFGRKNRRGSPTAGISSASEKQQSVQKGPWNEHRVKGSVGGGTGEERPSDLDSKRDDPEVMGRRTLKPPAFTLLTCFHSWAGHGLEDAPGERKKAGPLCNPWWTDALFSGFPGKSTPGICEEESPLCKAYRKTASPVWDRLWQKTQNLWIYEA